MKYLIYLISVYEITLLNRLISCLLIKSFDAIFFQDVKYEGIYIYISLNILCEI